MNRNMQCKNIRIDQSGPKKKKSSCRMSRPEGGRQKQIGPLWLIRRKFSQREERAIKETKSYPYVRETQICIEKS